MSIEIKICGLKTRESIAAAVDAGATHVGFVHFAKSPRHVSLEDAAALIQYVPKHVQSVLLVVSMEAPKVVAALQETMPNIVQFHGAESADGCAALRKVLPIDIWKAVGVKDASSLAKSQRFVGAVHRILYDAPAGKLPGGNGLALDWSLLAGHKHTSPWGLAGGLTPENVGEAIRQTGAPLVDTSTGVESAPGVKDIDKIRAFCQAAREA